MSIYEKAVGDIERVRVMFDQVWPHFPQGDKAFALRWFAMGWAVQQTRIDEYDARVEALATQVKEIIARMEAKQ